MKTTFEIIKTNAYCKGNSDDTVTCDIEFGKDVWYSPSDVEEIKRKLLEEVLEKIEN